MTISLEPIPLQTPPTEDEICLFGPFETLVPILVNGATHYVPAGNTVLRCMQYLELKGALKCLDWHRFCWNNTEGCCRFQYQNPDGVARAGRACVVEAKPGLEILVAPGTQQGRT